MASAISLAWAFSRESPDWQEARNALPKNSLSCNCQILVLARIETLNPRHRVTEPTLGFGH